uniref:Uncharacterized protein n=1 Tax=Arundo donax TaxID=35708 RepID=A0A0A9HJ33_ARUDO
MAFLLPARSRFPMLCLTGEDADTLEKYLGVKRTGA